MTEPQTTVAIIGSGIAGSTLAAILAKQNFHVLLIEAKEHPRFSIGESMILETSETMRALAELYDVPEIAYFSSENYFHKIGTSHGVKRHFGFHHHTAERGHDPEHTIQAVIPKEPHGHELHLYRQDSDYFMMQTAVQYGARILLNRRVKALDFESNRPRIEFVDGEIITADYVVDGSGYRSPVARSLDLRHTELETRSRAIFTHMIGVPPFEAATPLPFPMAEGTLHHVFDGGWLWVIPFDNHARSTNPICSVGLMLDPARFPEDRTLSPEQEFFKFIQRFPEIAAQLRSGKAVRPWVRAPRIQYGSTQVVGDRWALLGHAAGFVDPLFSKGLYVSLTTVSILAHQLIQGRAAGRFDREFFLPLERLTQAYLEQNDRLVANAYRSFKHPALWRRYAVLWLLGAYTEYLQLSMIRARAAGDHAIYYESLSKMRLVGGGYDRFDQISESIQHEVERVTRTDASHSQIQAAIYRIDQRLRAIDWLPDPFNAILDGAAALPKRKFRLSLFRSGRGFLGRGGYRDHFFENQSVLDLIQIYIREKWTYGVRPLPLISG